MPDGIFPIPHPENEPVLGYAAGSVERRQLKAELEKMLGDKIEIPVIVGGREITPVGEAERLPLCRLYLRLASAFLRLHGREPDAARVRQAAANAAARALRRTTIDRGWVPAALRTIALDRRLARPLLGHWRRRPEQSA